MGIIIYSRNAGTWNDYKANESVNKFSLDGLNARNFQVRE